MSGRATIDLSRLPPPDAVDPLDFEVEWAGLKAEIIAERPDLAPALALESAVVVRLAQALLYRLVLKTNEVNQGVRAVMPALATGADLDQIGVIVGIQRLMLDPGDPAEGIAPTYESDEAFRRRFIMAPEGYSVAGPAGAYEFHALSSDGDVLDATATSPNPGQVVVTVLSRVGDGTASAELLAAVEARVSADSVRPLTDFVTVQSATVKTYAIEATVWTYSGPDTTVVLDAAEASAQRFADDNHRLGRDVNLSAIYAALTVPGVMRVDLDLPLANVVCDETEVAYCTGIVLTHGGMDD